MSTERDELADMIREAADGWLDYGHRISGGSPEGDCAGAILAAGYRKTRAVMTAQDLIDRVRSIHRPIDAVMYNGERSYPRQVCTGCGQDDGNWQIWPCPTIRALEER